MATPKFGYGTEKEHGKTVGYTDKDSEIQRTIDVIKNRQSVGMDNSAQLNWYKQLTGSDYNPQPQFDQDAYMKQIQEQVNNMFNQQREAQLAQMRAQRDKAIGQINQQKTEVAPAYQTARNQTDAVNLQNVQRLREVMANSGLTASGENVTAQVAQNNQRQANLNSLNLQERQTLEDFDRRIADLNNPADEMALMAALEAERSRALLDFGMRADEIGYSRNRDSIMDQRYQTEWNYGVGRDQIADKRYDQEWDYQKMLDDRNWNQISPAELERMRLDFEYAQRRAALSGSSGRSSSGSSGGGGSSQSNLSSAYQQFQQQKSKSSSSPVDQYYNAMESIFKPIPRKDPVYPIPGIGSNANLSNYDRLQMIKQQYGIR